MEKSPDAFRTISEVADWLGVPTHVLRFWESRFAQVKPVKRAGGRRYYRPRDMELLGGIKKLLHDDGMTIRGVQKLLREEGVRHVSALSPPITSVDDDDSDVIDLQSSAAAPDSDPPPAPAPAADRSSKPDPTPTTPAPEAPMAVDVTEEAAGNVLNLGEKSRAVADDVEVSQDAAPPVGPRGEIADANEEPPITGFRAAKAAGRAMAENQKDQGPEAPEDDPKDDDASGAPEITGVARALRRARTQKVAASPDMDTISVLYGRLVQLRNRMVDEPGADSGK